MSRYSELQTEDGKALVVRNGHLPERFRRRRRISHNTAGIAVGKLQGKKMRPLLHAGDDRIRLAEVRLSMARRMGQRNKHLPLTMASLTDVIFDDGITTGKTMFVAKTIKNPLRRMPLLAVDRSVLLQNAINDSREGIQLRPFRWVAASISRRLRMPQYLLHGLARNTKPKSRFSLAQSM